MRFTGALPAAAAILALVSDGALATPNGGGKPARVDPNAQGASVQGGSPRAGSPRAGSPRAGSSGVGSSAAARVKDVKDYMPRRPTTDKQLLDRYKKDMLVPLPPGNIQLPAGVDPNKVPGPKSRSAPDFNLDETPCKIWIDLPTNPLGGNGRDYAEGYVAPGGFARFGDFICQASKTCIKPTCFEMPYGFRYGAHHMKYEFDLSFQQGRISVEEAEVNLRKLKEYQEQDAKKRREWEAANPPPPTPPYNFFTSPSWKH